MRQMNLRVADPRSFVIPANAGIQVVVFLGRALVGALSVYEINLWVVDPRQVPFLCTAKEKEPKERPPPSLRPRNLSAGALRSSPLPDARPTRRRRKNN